MTYVITLPCVDLKDRSCIEECPVDCIYEGDRMLYISDPGTGRVLFVDVESGSFARTAREEYPIFSSRFPSFEYSVYECAVQGVLAEGFDTPSGLALHDGVLYVAEYGTGRIVALDLATG